MTLKKGFLINTIFFTVTKAILIFSGGQDSTTCLGWAKKRFDEIFAITFDYGQRHRVEIGQAKKIASTLNVPIDVVDIRFYADLIHSSLTGAGQIDAQHEDNKDLPASFVPNRNGLFILLAHSFAQKKGIKTLIGGMCQTDYSGYPDCRESFTNGFSNALNLGSDQNIQLLTPLMHLTKAETFQLAQKEGVLDLVINESHTCYNGKEQKHAWGKGCGDCPACELRSKGYSEFLKMDD